MPFEAPLTAETLGAVALPVCVIEGSATSDVDHTICELVRCHVARPEHIVLEGAAHMIPLTDAAALTQALVGQVIETR